MDEPEEDEDEDEDEDEEEEAEDEEEEERPPTSYAPYLPIARPLTARSILINL